MLKSGPHYRFLAACLTGSRTEAEHCLHHPTWNWPTLLELAAEEQVLAGLHSAIAQVGLLAVVPFEIAAAFGSFYRLNQERNMTVWAELLLVTETLDAANIPCVLLKGVAYLAAGLFNETEWGARYLADIDLLLPLNNIEHAATLLRQHGFCVDSKDRLGTARHHYPPLVRPGNIGIELHHRLGSGKVDRLLPANLVLANAEEVQRGNDTFRVPSPDHLVTHLIAHSQLHHPYGERVWPPLRALADLQRLRLHFGPSLNWQTIEAAFAAVEARSIFRAHLRTIAAFSQQWDITFPLHGIDHLRWLHRSLLWRWPWLRMIDPLYSWHVIVAPRLHFVTLALAVPGAWKHLLKAPFRAHFYRRIWTDIFLR